MYRHGGSRASGCLININCEIRQDNQHSVRIQDRSAIRHDFTAAFGGWPGGGDAIRPPLKCPQHDERRTPSRRGQTVNKFLAF